MGRGKRERGMEKRRGRERRREKGRGRASRGRGGQRRERKEMGRSDHGHIPPPLRLFQQGKPMLVAEPMPSCAGLRRSGQRSACSSTTGLDLPNLRSLVVFVHPLHAHTGPGPTMAHEARKIEKENSSSTVPLMQTPNTNNRREARRSTRWHSDRLRASATCMLQRSAKSGTTSPNIRAEVKQDERCKTN